MAAFKNVNEVAITVATKQIFNINSRTLRDLANKYVPIEGMDMISEGLNIMHYSPNKNSDIKDKNQKVVDSRQLSLFIYIITISNRPYCLHSFFLLTIVHSYPSL